MCDVIYEPKGAALEYSPLACNLWLTCTHKCRYCYGPAVLHKTKEQFFSEAPERMNILYRLEQDCIKMQGDKRPVLLCFVCDAYQPHDEVPAITRQALEILERYRMTAQVLTKGGMRAARDFDILKRNKWRFGSTILFSHPNEKNEWEPGAAPLSSRMDAISHAHYLGIFTWVSVEPVIYPEQAIDIIKTLLPVVDFWKIGKLNHYKERELRVNWSRFLRDVRLLLKDRPHYIKVDLQAWEKK